MRIETEYKQTPYRLCSLLEATTAIAIVPEPRLQPYSDGHAQSRHESLKHTMLQANKGCPHQPSTKICVNKKPEDDHGIQFHNTVEDDKGEQRLLCNIEESLQKKMGGRGITCSHKHHLLTSKARSTAFQFQGQTNFNLIVCWAALTQEHTASSSSRQEA